jgi:hypothetical protein
LIGKKEGGTGEGGEDRGRRQKILKGSLAVRLDLIFLFPKHDLQLSARWNQDSIPKMQNLLAILKSFLRGGKCRVNDRLPFGAIPKGRFPLFRPTISKFIFS